MPLVLRFDAEKIPPILRSYLHSRGWVDYDEEVPENEQPPYNLWWKSARFTLSQLNGARYPAQRLNHFPKSSEITKKDTLLRNLRRMKVIYGQVCDVLPPSYILPGEYVKFCQAFADARDEGGSATWICKPSELSRGRKIFVFQDIGQLSYDCPSVVQSYIDRPLLLSGYKFDLRVYVLVTNFKPLCVYIYRNFLVRFGTEKYDISDLSNLCSHLTNTSLNRFAPGCRSEKEGIGEGCKWDAPRFESWLNDQGFPMSVLWTRIEAVINITLLSICGSVPSLPPCFELYGFDLLLDDQWKPWLLEVNFSPALHVDGPVDERVKGPLVRDMIDTLNIPEADAESLNSCTAPTPDSPTACAGRRRRRMSSRGVRAVKDVHASRVDAKPQPRDSAQGDFEKCFPFSPETESAAEMLALCPQNDRDGAMRGIVSEIKRKELQALQQTRQLVRKMQAGREDSPQQQQRKEEPRAAGGDGGGGAAGRRAAEGEQQQKQGAEGQVRVPPAQEVVRKPCLQQGGPATAHPPTAQLRRSSAGTATRPTHGRAAANFPPTTVSVREGRVKRMPPLPRL